MNVYADFAEDFMAIVKERNKRKTERFAGAEETCIEALMQDGKRFKQERHIFGAELCKTFDVKFANAEGKRICLGTSWGVSTRLMGALVMTHSDDKGLVHP
jgi:prolyl-tRNA synthetase